MSQIAGVPTERSILLRTVNPDPENLTVVTPIVPLVIEYIKEYSIFEKENVHRQRSLLDGTQKMIAGASVCGAGKQKIADPEIASQRGIGQGFLVCSYASKYCVKQCHSRHMCMEGRHCACESY